VAGGSVDTGSGGVDSAQFDGVSAEAGRLLLLLLLLTG